MRSLLLIAVLAITTVTAWAVDPTVHITQYTHTAWRLRDGFFGGSPNSITQTQDGYLWIPS